MVDLNNIWPENGMDLFSQCWLGTGQNYTSDVQMWCVDLAYCICYLQIFYWSVVLLRYRFKDVLECELITLKAFNSPYTVSSYRLAKLSEGFYREKSIMERKQTELLESMSEQNTTLDGACWFSLNIDMIVKNLVLAWESQCTRSKPLVSSFRWWCQATGWGQCFVFPSVLWHCLLGNMR